MGIWEFINSTTESVKRNTPTLTPIKNACKTTVDYGSAAASTVGYYALTPIKTACKTTIYYGSAAAFTVDNAVRVNGLRKVNEYMPDEEGRAKLGVFATKFAKQSAFYLLHEGYKHIPGGKAVAKITSATVNEMKSENHKGVEVKALKKSNGTIMGSNDHGTPLVDLIGNQKPEDVLRVFMMKEFMGTRLVTWTIL